MHARDTCTYMQKSNMQTAKPVTMVGPFPHNSVSTFSAMPHKLNIPAIVWALYGYMHQPRKGTIVLPNPQCSIKIQEGGKGSITGARLFECAVAACHVLRLCLVDIGVHVEIYDPQEHTLMATAYLSHRVDLAAAYAGIGRSGLAKRVSYKPKKFVGFVVQIEGYFPKESARHASKSTAKTAVSDKLVFYKTSFTVFDTGSIVITGAKTPNHAAIAVERFFPIISQYCCEPRTEEELKAAAENPNVVEYENGVDERKTRDRMRTALNPENILGDDDMDVFIIDKRRRGAQTSKRKSRASPDDDYDDDDDDDDEGEDDTRQRSRWKSEEDTIANEEEEEVEEKENEPWYDLLPLDSDD